MPDLKITILTEANLQGARASEDQLRRLNQEVKQGSRETNDFNARQMRMNALMVAAAGAIAAATKSLREFASTEQAVQGLDAALAQNGLLTDQLRERYQELAGQLQTTTGIADSQWLETLTRLTQFGSRPESIGIDIEAVKNLAGILRGDLRQAADAYSRALQGQFEAFGEQGIRIDANLSQMEKMEQLQRRLAEVGGGQLEARLESLNGQWDAMSNEINDVFKGFGNLANQTGVLSAAMDFLRGAANGLKRLLPDTVEQSDALANSFDDGADAARKEGQAIEVATQHLKNRNDEIERKKRIEDTQRSAATAAELAELDLAEAEGRITPEQANVRRAEIRLRDERSAANEAFLRTQRQRAAIEEQRAQAAANAGTTQSAAAAAQSEFEKAAQEAGFPPDLNLLSEQSRAYTRLARRDPERFTGERDTINRLLGLGRNAATLRDQALTAGTAADQVFSSTEGPLREILAQQQAGSNTLRAVSAGGRAEVINARNAEIQAQQAQEAERTRQLTERQLETQRQINELLEAGFREAGAAIQRLRSQTRGLRE